MTTDLVRAAQIRVLLRRGDRRILHLSASQARAIRDEARRRAQH